MVSSIAATLAERLGHHRGGFLIRGNFKGCERPCLEGSPKLPQPLRMMRRAPPGNHRCFGRSWHRARTHGLHFGIGGHTQAKCRQKESERDQQSRQDAQGAAVTAPVIADDTVQIRDAGMLTQPACPAMLFIKGAYAFPARKKKISRVERRIAFAQLAAQSA